MGWMDELTYEPNGPYRVWGRYESHATAFKHSIITQNSGTGVFDNTVDTLEAAQRRFQEIIDIAYQMDIQIGTQYVVDITNERSPHYNTERRLFSAYIMPDGALSGTKHVSVVRHFYPGSSSGVPTTTGNSKNLVSGFFR